MRNIGSGRQLLEELLEQACRSAEHAEVYSVSHRSTQAIFEANRLKSVQTKESEGTALRLVKDGRIGFSATSKPQSGRELLSMALEMAPFGAHASFDFPGLQAYPDVPVFDPDVEAVSEEAMVHLGQSLIDRVRAAEPEITCEASVTRGISSIQVANSRGGGAAYQKTVFGIGVEGVLIRGTDMLFVGDHETSCHPVATGDSVVRSTVEQLERARSLAASPVGMLPVLFGPHGVASCLLAPLAIAFNGKTVLRGASPVGPRKGEQVFAPELVLWDDATIDFRPASSPCDDEGIPSQRTTLIDRGVVTGFVYDLQTAGQAGTKSTGNGSRSLGSLPGPSPSALVIGDGTTSFADMLAGIKDGLVVEQVMGATQGNVLGGDFSGNVLLGYRVEKGRITGRVKNTMISGNVYDILKEGVVFGSDSRWVGGSLRTPSVYCPSVSVAAKD